MAKKTPVTRDAPREMAAVMFTDVRGYSSLSQHDEALAVRLLDVKQGLAGPLIAKHHGRLIKTIGDALMVEFRSALAAVECAVALQKRLHEHNATRPATEKLVVRIGVHVGDVIRKGDDLFGDTVNLAARVEPEAPAGGIAVTQAVHDQIRGKIDSPLVALGDFKLKGMRDEMTLFAVQLPWEAASPVVQARRPGFLARLKQHHLFRVVSLYATVGWVLILVANQVFPDIGLTREDARYLIAAVALLFPVAVAVSWMVIPPSREDPERYGRWKRLRFRIGMVFSALALGIALASGAYLWRLDSQRTVPSRAEAVAVLPFDRLGPVDASLSDGLQRTLETTLAGLGSANVISHSALVTSAERSPLDAARAAGATYVIEGSIQRADDHAPFTVQAEVVSVADAAPLFSFTEDYAPGAPAAALEQEVASRLAGPVRFQTRPDEWLARGFKTTSNPQALELLREALMAYYYNGSASQLTLARQAVDLDPSFAQAHAYLAYFMMVDDRSEPSQRTAQDELATAERLAPGLPEVHLARGAIGYWLREDEMALRELAAVDDAFPNNFLMHFTYGRELHLRERDQEALRELLLAAAIDPIQTTTTDYTARIYFFNRDYESADGLLAQDEAQWPLNPDDRLYRAMVAFAKRGDVPALAQVVDGDWSAYRIQGNWLAARQIEVAHLEGRHEAVLKLLAAYPNDLLENTRLFNILGRMVNRDSFAVESLKLLGRDAEARRQALLDLPAAEAALAHPRDLPDIDRMRVAELEAFGGDPGEALKTVAPILARLQGDEASWAPGDHLGIEEVAVVLAWSGETGEAIDLLAKSLAVRSDTHAAILARDPVWRPLYKDPAFKALLAAHGQVLTYAK